jgi:Tfp pilus assembly protein PilW
MNHKRTTLIPLAAAALLLSGCTNASTSDPKPAAAPTAASAAPPAKGKATDAASAFTAVSSTVATAKAGTTVTAENDPNHLLGRPGQYTSKITFTDSRINANDVDGLDPDDVQRGGAIEAFGTPTAAKARADYIQAASKTIPALAEYDYVHGPTLIRVSHYLTPAQAAEYEKAAGKLP